MSNAEATAKATAKEPLTKAEQRRPFSQTARELGGDDGQALDAAAFGTIVPPKVAPSKDRA